MSDTKFTPGQWVPLDESKFTDTSMGKITYERAVFDGVVADVSMFKAAPDLYKALEEMCDMWTTVCDAQGWEPEHVIQHRNALISLVKARGE